jgi:hypothetical protein
LVHKPYRSEEITGQFMAVTNLSAGWPGGLDAGHFKRIAFHGFGDPLNSYAHSMAWFKGYLYVGTMRASLHLLHARVPIAMDPWPIRTVKDIYELDLRAQIWRWSPVFRHWQQIYVAPFVKGRSGNIVARELSYRGMAVSKGSNGMDDAMYVATWSTSKGQGPLILRSADGEHFTPMTTPGLGDPTVSAFRSLASFGDRLFAAPSGRTGGKTNTPDIAAIYVASKASNGPWYVACQPGFGDAGNLTMFEMEVFNGFLYVGTLNPQSGFQIWKSACHGQPPYQWTMFLANGAARGPLNETTVSMCVFNGALYVGTGIQNGGYDRAHKIGPAAAELIRIHPNDSWDLIVGERRWTSNGWKIPLSGLEPGFNNFFNGYFWRLAEHQGVLYLGTFDWSVLLPYLKPVDQGGAVARFAQTTGIDNIVGFEGGFDLFSSQDGVRWAPVTTNGFGNPYNFGARTMVSTPHGLFVGTANPFGPEIGARTATGWTCVENSQGGAEIWLGAP